MPEIGTAIATAITYVANAATAVSAGTATIGQTLAVAAVQTAVSAATQAAITAIAGKPRSEGTPTDFRLDTDAGIPTAYGRVGVGGNIVHRTAYGIDNKYLTLFCTAGTGPIRAVLDFRSNDELLSFDANGKALDGPNSGYLWFENTLGAQPDVAIQSPSGAGADPTGPTTWTSAHKLSGMVAWALTMLENEKRSEFPGGVVRPRLTIEGVFGWDPREDSTWPGGSGACRLLDPSTWPWIEDPHIAALNWTIGRWAGPSTGGGYGVPYASTLVNGIGARVEGIDVDAFVRAANVSEARGWKITAFPSSKDDKFAMLAQMLQAGGSVPARVAGRISCVNLGEEVASVVTVTAADTAGLIELNLGPSRLERRNTGYPRHMSEAHLWNMVQLGPVSDTDWIGQDGARRSRGMDYPMVPDKDHAAQLDYLALAHDRERISGTVPFRPHMRRIQPGDCFTINDVRVRGSAIKVRALKRGFDPASLTARISFREETDAKFAAALAQTGTAPGEVVPVPPFTYVEPPTDGAVEESDGGALLSWRNGEYNFFRTAIYRSATADFADAVEIATSGGAALENRTYSDTPGAGVWAYFLLTRSFSDEESSEVGPFTVVVGDVLTNDAGAFLTNDAGAYLIAG